MCGCFYIGLLISNIWGKDFMTGFTNLFSQSSFKENDKVILDYL